MIRWFLFALEAQVEVLFRKDEFPVNKNVQIAQHFHRNGWVTQAPFQHIFIKEIAAVAPNGLLRIVLTHMAQDANKNRLIFRFKGLPTQKGEAPDIVRFQGFHDFLDGMLVKRLAIRKIPSFLIETAFTVMGTAAYEKGDTDTRSIGDICFLIAA